MDKVLNDTWNTDVGRVRNEGMMYLVPFDGFPTPTMLDLKDKANKRGFNNNITARMLCPFHLLPTFDKDPEAYVPTLSLITLTFIIYQIRFCRQVRDGKIALTAGDLPLYLYLSPIYTPGASYMEGLLLGDFLVSVLSPSIHFLPLKLTSLIDFSPCPHGASDCQRGC